MTNPSHTKDFKEAAEKYANTIGNKDGSAAFDFIKGCNHGYAEAMKEQHWIPVSERMPEVSKVIIAYKFGVGEAMYFQGRFIINVETEFPDVTHWMPLPSPPSFIEQEQSKHNTNGE